MSKAMHGDPAKDAEFIAACKVIQKYVKDLKNLDHKALEFGWATCHSFIGKFPTYWRTRIVQSPNVNNGRGKGK